MRSIVNSVITVGAFDGVHLGHQAILHKLKEKAIAKSCQSTVVTFWPHPSQVLGSRPLKLINTLEEKKALIKSHGIDNVIILPFTYDFSKINSFTFIKDYLIEQFGMKFFLLGYNHHFGNDRQGDINVIKHYGEQLGFQVEKALPVEVNGEKISSTKIRHALTEGNLDQANTFLGYQFFITGEVVRGQMLGRTIGFPTANVHITDDYKLLPKDGVYAVTVELNGSLLKGMLNIGHRPTVNREKHLKTIEVHLIDFDSDIYGQELKVNFIKRIRDEIKFKGIESLKNQLIQDKNNVLSFLG